MKITNNIEMLELEATLSNGAGVIHPVIIWDETDVVLFDAGLPGMRPQINDTAAEAGIPIERLNRILITHSDMDHIGSLAQFIHESQENITVIAHKEEKPYIECVLPPVRLKQMENGIHFTEGAMRAQLIALTESLKQNYHSFKVDVDQTVEDGEILPFCGGITCIYTPGHSPGHMCYYLKEKNLLIAGDILQVKDGSLVKCPDFTTLNKKDVAASLKKLSRYAIDKVVCYHGGFFTGDVSRRIAEIAAE